MKIGDKFEEKITFHYQEMITFLDLVKDINPVHRYECEEMIKPLELKPLSVQGMFAVCMFSGLLSRYFPNSVNVRRSATFVRPMYLEEEHVMSVKVISIDVEQYLGTLKCLLKNSKGKICIDCTTEIKNEVLFK